MTTDTVTPIAEAACAIAKRGAAEYLARHDFTADPEALAASLRTWVKAKLSEALADAKQALDCGMGQAAQATFAATMVNAGVEAAKECAMPAREVAL